MQVSVLSLSDALAASHGQGEKRPFDFWETAGTSGCYLFCASVRRRDDSEPGVSRRTPTSSEETVRVRDITRIRGRLFTFADLEKSASNGCGSCKTVKSILEMLPIEYLGPLRQSTSMRWGKQSTFVLDIQDQAGTEHCVRILNLNNSSNHFKRMGYTNGLSGDTASSLSLQRVRGWLKGCEDGHGKCGIGRDVILPTRLVDVAKIFRGSESGVKLIDSTGQRGTYMCLSHCWGKAPIEIMTKKSSLQERLDFIPSQELPPSFHQAIQLVRKLGIPYLWIDSLCIIQNDDEDWKREAAQMVNIYRNAYATLAVTWSPDSRGGCFSKVIPTQCFNLRSTSGHEFMIGVGIGVKSDISEFARVKQYFPLYNRAWCLQERLLSRRVIHCHHGEMAFDCGDINTCECGGRQHWAWDNVVGLGGTYTPLRSRSRYLGFLWEPTGHSSALKSAKGKRVDAYERWHRVVSEYTCLNLTKQTDMLPALSGLTAETAELTGDLFLAGLWESYLKNDLLWYVHTVAEWRQNRKEILARKRTAPSWSWASLGSGCKVTFQKTEFAMALPQRLRSIADDATITCNLVDGETKGRFQSRSSRLPIMLHRPCSKFNSTKRGTSTKYGKFMLYSREDNQEWHEGCRPMSGEAHLGFGPVQSKLHVDPVVEVLPYITNNKPTENTGICKYCALLPACLVYIRGLEKQVGQEAKNRFRDYFMVLVDSRDGSTGDYERVGLLEVWFQTHDMRDVWYDEVWTPLAKSEASITI
ncbi:hypothetical protein CDV36_005305 [Fusarium kuroshium]|uniref:Heterokaryon incompatibility domain-containing protein n=1 Tax=Fusarium kuroshium TaxID=2010991 RepID=A0A3M2SBT0_9HYPO|nr:hypothetical protein CDV36_005305 [Fusarium kuroshium]